MNKNLGAGFFIFSMLLVLGIGLMIIFTVHYLTDWTPEGFFPLNIITASPAQLTLDLSSPDNNSLVFDSGILVEGKTKPNTSVLISSETGDQIIQSDKNGEFSQTLKLELGINNLLITAFDNQGNSISARRSIFYSQQSL